MLHIVMSMQGLRLCCNYFDPHQDEIFLLLPCKKTDIPESVRAKCLNSSLDDETGSKPSDLASLIEKHAGKTVSWF